MIKWFITFFCSLFLIFTVQAQDNNSVPWTLKTCLEHAVKNSNSIKSGMLNVASSKINYDQSKLNALPTLNGNAGHNYNYGRTIDPITNSYISQQIQSNSFGLSIGLNVFNGFQNTNNIKRERFNYLASQKELEVTQDNLSLSIANLYLQVLQNKEILKVSEEQLLSTKLQLENMLKRIELGNRSEGDKYALEAQVATDEMNVQQAKNNVAIALLNLKSTLQLSVETGFEIAVPSNAFLNNVQIDTSESILDIYQKNLNDRPEIQAADLRKRAADYQLKVAKGGLSPRLSFGANLNTRYADNGMRITNPRLERFQIGEVENSLDKVFSYSTIYDRNKASFSNQMDDNFGQSIGFSLSVPLFNGLNAQNNIKLAKVGLDQVDLQKKNAEYKYLTDLTQAKSTYSLAEKSLVSSNKNRTAQKLNLEYNEKRYQAGAMDFSTYSISKNNLNIAEAQYIQAKYQYVFSGLVLNFYKGLPIEIE